jgi:AhpD family alkylhydroperoxidase
MIPGGHGFPAIPASAQRGEIDRSVSAHEQLYPPATRELAQQRRRLAPGPAETLRAFSQRVFAEGALPTKTKQLIAVAVAHVTQCPYCIRGHTGAAMRHGATAEEILEAIWVAAEMRAGGVYAHSVVALDTIARDQAEKARVLAEKAHALAEVAGVPGADIEANVGSVG